jgi:hypothetical protein
MKRPVTIRFVDFAPAPALEGEAVVAERMRAPAAAVGAAQRREQAETPAG